MSVVGIPKRTAVIQDLWETKDGALEVERSDGEIVRVIAGDVTLAKEDALP